MAKKMVMPFFDQQGAIFTSCVLLGHHCQCCLHCPGHLYEATEAEKVVAAAAGKWFLCWNNAPVHITAFFVQVAGKAQHPSALSPSLFIKYSTCRLCSFPKGLLT
jgi:hypothetical protein